MKSLLIITINDQMLQKASIGKVDPKTLEFYSTFFLVPKKDGGQRPVFKLKRLKMCSGQIFQNVDTSIW